jgi:SAM-dependent methyltransferase
LSDALICRVCQKAADGQRFKVKEMNLGLRDEFEYFQCSECDCLQILEVPEMMGTYYPQDRYYSYNIPKEKSNLVNSLKDSFRKILISAYLRRNNFLISLFSVLYPSSANFFPWIRALKGMNTHSRILDIGTGNGNLLLELKKLGFKNLKGIDPFIENDINHGNGITIHKHDIFGVAEQFNIVMFHHSFEHLEEPHKILQKAGAITKTGGYLIIRIPVVDSYAWRYYGVNWYQIDAPRHFILYSKQALVELVKKHDFSFVSLMPGIKVFLKVTVSTRLL